MAGDVLVRTRCPRCDEGDDNVLLELAEAEAEDVQQGPRAVDAMAMEAEVPGWGVVAAANACEEWPKVHCGVGSARGGLDGAAFDVNAVDNVERAARVVGVEVAAADGEAVLRRWREGAGGHARCVSDG